MTGHYRILVPRYPARTVTFEHSWQTKQIESDHDKRLHSAWHKFRLLCSSLHNDGLTYDVAFNVMAEEPHLLITARGTAKVRKRYRSDGAMLSAVIPHKRCTKELADSQKHVNVIRRCMTKNRMGEAPAWRYQSMVDNVATWETSDSNLHDVFNGYTPADWRDKAAQRKVLGAWLAKRFRTGGNRWGDPTAKDYRELDAISGNRAKRISELPVRSRPNGIREYVLSVLCGSRRNSWDREQSKEQAHPFPFAEYQSGDARCRVLA